MNDADRETIRRQLPSLLASVQLSEELLDQLQRLRVLTLDFREELDVEPRPRERLRRLLLEIPRRGPDAFDGLVKALLETGQLEPAKLLRPGLTHADLSPAALAAISAAAIARQAAQRAPHCTPTTPVHRPPPVQERPPLTGDRPPPPAAGDRPDAPGPSLHLRPTDTVRGSERDTYRMISSPRGLALVISNINFRNTDLHETREGGERDEVALPSLLKQLGFEVQLERDLDRAQLLDTISAFAKRPEHGMYDMAVLAVLTHGGQHVLYGVDSRPLEVEQVISCFSHEAAPPLTGKPKWMLFQACRGAEGNRASRLMDSGRQATDGKAISAPVRMVAEYGDIFLTYSSIPGYVSMRDLDHGTWLVQVLCQVFAELAHSHTLSELHRVVHDRMASMVTSRNEKQTIETAQRGWSKKLYFNPGL
ncbi:Caspase-2 [Amphibalanus amphitrite]|uniref:Caspase-2 n=1 Tax=Amphibalanus amphitrite TaxID=1232801 RepID=A0A6A4WJM4_AMPAM|nr:Caspase-2 [Amphibalanus amphitrite]